MTANATGLVGTWTADDHRRRQHHLAETETDATYDTAPSDAFFGLSKYQYRHGDLSDPSQQTCTTTTTYAAANTGKNRRRPGSRNRDRRAAVRLALRRPDGDGRYSGRGPLDEGTVGEGCVTCPWHGSTFRFADGGIVRGPASTPQPLYETQIRDGQIEVRVAR